MKLPSSSSSFLPLGPFLLLLALSTLSGINGDAQESDRILRLPGQPPAPPLSQFSGHITVNQPRGRALFYWFFEARSDPAGKPLLLWLNGGPGCSSIGYGAAVELGPLRVARRGSALEFNPFAWNQEANLLFLESPVGVGFSYTNTTSDLAKLDDAFVAEDAYSFLVNWLERFPQYKSNDFYMSGESYAGHYVPQLADLVYDRNLDGKHPRINFKGFIVGNPETEDYLDTKGLVEYAWSHSVVSDEMYQQVCSACDFTLPAWTQNCSAVMRQLFQQYREIDIYNIYAPKCYVAGDNSSSPAESARIGGALGRMRVAGGYDPCYSGYAEEYFNRVEVKAAMHANATGSVQGDWKVCNNSMLYTYNFTVASVLPIYTKLIKAGLRIWIYSGDADGRVPVIGSRYCVEALGLVPKSQWRPWYHNHQVGGRFVEYEGLTMATVRGAGHLVPLNKPSEALALINAYLTGRRLPTQRS